MRSQYETFGKLVETATTIWCICHANPDGDALGSMLGLQSLLAKQYPQKKVRAFCKDPAPQKFMYLPGAKELCSELVLHTNDLVIFTDCAVPKQTGLTESHSGIFTKQYLTVNIDHHLSNSAYAYCNIVQSDVASACEVVYNIAQHFNWSITPNIATQLLTGLLTDTGSLLHSNTTANTYSTAAALLKSKADHTRIVKDVFRTGKLSTLRLWGRVLEKIATTPEGGAISAVTSQDFAYAEAEYSELNGAIDYVNSVPGMRFSLVLAEKDQNLVKGSLRTLRPDVDVSKMAGKFDGGGHKAAAGFSIEGSLTQKTSWEVRPSGQN